MLKKFTLALLVLTVGVLALDNGLGLTPPMGYNTWNAFHCQIDENLIKQTANAMVNLGLAAKGYTYLNLDDCWQISRDENSRIVEDKEKFPSGIKALSKYVHSKGLKFGLYSDAGFKTCQGRPGSLGFEEIDAKTYAEWEIDYLKYDNCNTDGSSPKKRYPPMRDALNKTGRPIFFSMCEWGFEKPHLLAGDVANSWRTTMDIQDKWLSFIYILNRQIGLEKHSGPGRWNDPDMLEVGNGGMKHDE